MKQTISARRERPLLNYAISRLRPGVFSHPVWIRFGNTGKPIPAETLQNLFHDAEQLWCDQPSDACQILLICSVLQNCSGQRSGALATIQNALELAESAGLIQEILWVIWGACAVCVQQGQYELADRHFRHLQSALHEQNEWILADYVDMVRQYFLSPANTGEAGLSSSTEGQELITLLSSTFDLLYKWGVSSQTGLDPPGDPSMEDTSMKASMKRSDFPPEEQPGPWHTLKLMFQGELKLHWIKNNHPPDREQSSLRESILGWLGLHHPGRQREAEIIEAEPPITGPSQPEIDPTNVLPDPAPPKNAGAPENDPVEIKPVEQILSIPSLSVHMLGKFEMSIQNETLDVPVSRNLSVLKYLILNHKQSTPREVLMDVFWPESEPVTARNNLNVAIHGIRRTLRRATNLPLILYKDGAYSISPDIPLWLDMEEFEHLINSGQQRELRNRPAAVAAYEAAISIYEGDFLQENPYEEWTVLTREHLRASYLDTLDRLSRIYFDQQHYAACITVCQRILSYDSCREDAYCLLMRCYSRQGQDHLALRQYQACAKALHAEMDVEPAPETTKLYNRLRRHEPV